MKKLTLIASVFVTLLHVSESLASPIYAGIVFQKSAFQLDESGSNNIEYDKNATNISGFIGYEFEKGEILPYTFSIEGGYFQDSNSQNGVKSEIDNQQKTVYSSDPNINSNIKTKILSLNTIHNYDITDKFALMGIVGLSYANFKFNEYNNNTGYASSGKAEGFGANIGIGLSFKMPDIYTSEFSKKIMIRTKIVHTAFNDIKPNIAGLDKISGMTKFNIDFGIKF